MGDLTVIAGSRLNVLIIGECGVGKQYTAERVHAKSGREGAFLRVNCSADPDVVELNLFGNAPAKISGVFERTPSGTVFLDHISHLPARLQERLVSVIEDRFVCRVGSVERIPIDTRFIASCRHNLLPDVEAGKFLDELYYRLVGVTMTILPLRARRDEIIPLAQDIVRSCAESIDRRVELTEDACDWLYEQPWPGNFRELRVVCERAVLLASGPQIDRAQISRTPLVGQASRPPVEEPSGFMAPRATPLPSHLRASLADIEKQAIVTALERCGGNQRRAAEILGIARRTLSNRLDQYNIGRPRKRAD